MKTDNEIVSEIKEKYGYIMTQRDSLADSIRIRSDEIKDLTADFERSLEPKKKHLNKLIGLLRDVRSKLYELGVPAEDC